MGLVDWLPLALSLAESRPGTLIFSSSSPHFARQAFDLIILTLKRERPVLIFDNRGVGGSFLPKEKESDDYDVKDMANDVVELIKVGHGSHSLDFFPSAQLVYSE